jgi:uncharacterized MAPEG superfamily protein
MNHAVLPVLIAGLLPIVCAGIAKWGAKDYDNRHPRAWMATQDGRRARADAAQQNSFEAFPFFAAAVGLALWSQADALEVTLWGWFFVAMRVAYIYCYVTDRATTRSLCWMFGFAAVIRLFVMALLSQP